MVIFYKFFANYAQELMTIFAIN